MTERLGPALAQLLGAPPAAPVRPLGMQVEHSYVR
jgi:hypothetical protein